MRISAKVRKEEVRKRSLPAELDGFVHCQIDKQGRPSAVLLRVYDLIEKFFFSKIVDVSFNSYTICRPNLVADLNEKSSFLALRWPSRMEMGLSPDALISAAGRTG